jgi:DNA-binding NtrC family response regulator
MRDHQPLVLVVEDCALIRFGAVEFLQDAGFSTLEANGADEAIKILEVSPNIHVVFTDIDMPGSIDGLILSHYVNMRWPPVHLIIASGVPNAYKNDMPLGSKFFPKPYSYTAVVNTIRSMLKSDSLRRFLSLDTGNETSDVHHW